MRLCVVVTPRSGKDAVLGWKVAGDGGDRELAVSVTAAPEGGKATKAVCDTIARSIGVPRGAVTCIRGATSRHKQIEVDCDQGRYDAWSSGLGQKDDR